MATHSSIVAWRIPWTGTWWVTVRNHKSRTRLKRLSAHCALSHRDPFPREPCPSCCAPAECGVCRILGGGSLYFNAPIPLSPPPRPF